MPLFHNNNNNNNNTRIRIIAEIRTDLKQNPVQALRVKGG